MVEIVTAQIPRSQKVDEGNLILNLFAAKTKQTLEDYNIFGLSNDVIQKYKDHYLEPRVTPARQALAMYARPFARDLPVQANRQSN